MYLNTLLDGDRVAVLLHGIVRLKTINETNIYIYVTYRCT